MRKPDQTLNLRLAPDDQANESGLRVSQEASLLSARTCARIGERWNEENCEAISEYNTRIAVEGLPLEKYRTF